MELRNFLDKADAPVLAVGLRLDRRIRRSIRLEQPSALLPGAQVVDHEVAG